MLYYSATIATIANIANIATIANIANIATIAISKDAMLCVGQYGGMGIKFIMHVANDFNGSRSYRCHQSLRSCFSAAH